MEASPFQPGYPRPETRDGVFSREEVALANRNSGILLETLSLDVTPVGLHYLLNHFDVPLIDENDHRLLLDGAFDAPLTLSMQDIRALPQVTERVTLECAGNGREGVSPRSHLMPWMYEAVGTSEWMGTPLAPLLERARPREHVQDFVFTGADFGFDKGHAHSFARSLTPDQIADLEVMLVWGMNGQPLLPQHGAPLRIIVPGWYGMASVKWLTSITALTERFDGYQQKHGYHYRQRSDEAGTPITRILVKSLIKPPGVPDWVTRKRWLVAGPVTLEGRAWSGGGVPIESVEVFLDGVWQEADLTRPKSRYAWTHWQVEWAATPGVHHLICRATDAEGNTQPMQSRFDAAGFGNNSVHRVEVHVSDIPA
ncbi:sulfite oxidase [Marivita hallyeonensis]|uniref:Mo-co oxidoreductase dimerisation domain-containing protein n=1 Tax=Marivita hallyeonensis TaxID=996342 RepID=A0A1M5PJJ1_9RHOB|nr:sulfite oxidase [Marivita hallyeonensis]SHH01996.1 Mo-co oxidoreductase dimerisation domain-containing protein [Marivita hallyeonensis]